MLQILVHDIPVAFGAVFGQCFGMNEGTAGGQNGFEGFALGQGLQVGDLVAHPASLGTDFFGVYQIIVAIHADIMTGVQPATLVQVAMAVTTLELGVIHMQEVAEAKRVTLLVAPDQAGRQQRQYRTSYKPFHRDHSNQNLTSTAPRPR